MFTGSTLNFASTLVTNLVGMTFKKSGAWVDVSLPEDANKLFELGQAELEVALKFKKAGLGGLSYGLTGTAAIIWKDGSTSNCPGTWVVDPTNQTGDYDAALASDCVLRPTVP